MQSAIRRRDAGLRSTRGTSLTAVCVSNFAGLGAWTVNAYDTNNAAFTAGRPGSRPGGSGADVGDAKPPIIINFNGTQNADA